MKFNDEPQHESHGMIRISHTSCSPGAILYGSPVRCPRTVRICIKEGRQTSTDDGIFGRFNSGGKIIAEIDMSPTQFAEMLTTPNHGDGVPCTLRYYRIGDNLKRCEDPPPWESDAAHIRRAFSEKVSAQTGALEAMRRKIDGLLDEAKITRERREEIKTQLNGFYRLLTDSAPFVMDQFEEHTAAVVQVAKAEVAGFVEHVVRETGIKALRGAVEVTALKGGDE